MQSTPQRQINQKDVVATALDNEAIILNLRTKYYFTANETAWQIWQLIAQGKTESEIVEQLTEEFDVDPKHLSDDIEELLKRMTDEGLLEIP